jgi:hypothetical protein
MPGTPKQDDLSDDDIAFLCEIGEFDVEAASEAKRGRLERMLAQGLIEPDESALSAGRYQLTEKAEDFLTARGVGLNEA